MRCFLFFVGLGVAALGGGALTFYAGWYDISATDQHLAPTYWLLDRGLKRSVKFREERISVPRLDDPALAQRGAGLYKRHCEQCHGGPGVAPAPFALGMTPSPAMLSYSATEWSPAALFWVVKEGIKMTGMPAWKYRMTDDEMWAIVAFVEELPRLTPSEYRALKPPPARAQQPEVPAVASAKRGQEAINQYICVTCHHIPGIVGPNAPVGPPLNGIGSRAYIAGVIPNTTENMVRWLMNPQEIDMHTAMPNLGVTERDARDMAAYLATLEKVR